MVKLLPHEQGFTDRDGVCFGDRHNAHDGKALPHKQGVIYDEGIRLATGMMPVMVKFTI